MKKQVKVFRFFRIPLLSILGGSGKPVLHQRPLEIYRHHGDPDDRLKDQIQTWLDAPEKGQIILTKSFKMVNVFKDQPKEVLQ